MKKPAVVYSLDLILKPWDLLLAFFWRKIKYSTISAVTLQLCCVFNWTSFHFFLALEKLRENVESEKFKKSKIRLKSSNVRKEKWKAAHGDNFHFPRQCSTLLPTSLWLYHGESLHFDIIVLFSFLCHYVSCCLPIDCWHCSWFSNWCHTKEYRRKCSNVVSPDSGNSCFLYYIFLFIYCSYLHPFDANIKIRWISFCLLL